MDRNFAKALSHVLKHEGGFVNHPKDPGGATNKGVTIGTFRRYVDPKATVDDLKRITAAQVAQVYRKHYWDVVKADDLPSGIDYAVFDFAVNSGPGRAAEYLQAVVRGVTIDGKIGPATIKATKAKDPAWVIQQLCGSRMSFLRSLKTWPTFSKGWTRRVTDVQQVALVMAGAKVAATSPAPAKPVAPVAKHWLVVIIEAAMKWLGKK